MILQALTRYYQRLSDDREAEVAPPGFGKAPISFALVLNREGELVDEMDLRQQDGKKLVPRQLLTPLAVTRSGSGFSPNFLWDNITYVLGAAKLEGLTEKEASKKAGRAQKAGQAFRELVHRLCDGLDDPGLVAVLKFLDNWRPEMAPELEHWPDMTDSNLVFRLDGERKFVHESEAAKRIWLEYWAKQEAGAEGQCLVSGEHTALARLHPAIKGVWGAQPTGARLVSFNLDAFTSFGKEQNYNAPVGKEAAFAYTTALNRLLAAGSRQRIRVGEASVVFWSEKASEVEVIMGQVISRSKSDDTALNDRLAAFLEAAKQGLPLPELEAENPFYILGLSPNASRLSVRFWHVSTVGEIKDRLGEHLRDMEIVRQSDRQPEHPPLWMLLRETAAQGKEENIPPLLAGEMARAIFTGRPYPKVLLSALISRIRADRTLGYVRAAMLKAYLARQYRLNQTYRHNPKSMEVTVSLDMESKNPAYLLGRLFAVMENLQSAALPGIKATIRDKYFASASSAPRASFPHLLRNAHNHFAKLRKQEDKGGLAGFFDNALRDILDGIEADDGFPTTLNMEEQGLFFLGYYHQKAYRSPKNEDPDTLADSAADKQED